MANSYFLNLFLKLLSCLTRISAFVSISE